MCLASASPTEANPHSPILMPCIIVDLWQDSVPGQNH